MGCSRLNLSSAASFDNYELQHPFAEGQFRYVARGVYTNGPRCGQPCVCKWFKSGVVYERTFFEKDLKAVGKAQEIINAFYTAGITTSRISLNHPEVWVFRYNGSHAGQHTLTEPFINNYRKFNSNSGYVGGYDHWSEVMQALSHYSYHKTGGHMVLCDLQGGITSRGAVLTDPVILSRTRAYGVTDLGPNGISTFFARHRCTRFCQAHWQRPRYAAMYYQMTSSTTMELVPAARPGLQLQPVIYEDDDDDDYYGDGY
eukprot:gene12365-12500_t